MTDAPILLVEDNPDDVALTVRAFAKTGIGNRIVVAADGEECLALLAPDAATGPLRPAIVLLDINLPRVSGLELLRRMRALEHTRSLPVIVLTTSKEDHDIAESYRLGANSFIRKPVGFSEFLGVVHALGTYWLRVNEPLPTAGCAP